MNRKIVYSGAIPLDNDVLYPQQRAMVAIGYALQAAFGTGTLFDGLNCGPTSPASMQVVVQPGLMITSSVVEATPYGSLPANTTDPLVKMGINQSTTTFNLTAPVTAGQSQNYLIQGTFLEEDTTPLVLPYYNSANPSQPFTGPNGSSTPQNTVRSQSVNLQLKVGAPANTGTQATPPVDNGWFGLWVITVQTGQASITSAAISKFPGALFVPAKIPALAPLASPALTGTPTAPTPTAGDSTIKLATTAFVQGAISSGFSTRRTVVNANTILYVAPNGNDGNSGLLPGTPFLTIQAAINAFYFKFDWGGYQGTISVANGSYTGGAVFIGTPIGHTLPILFTGNAVTPANVSINATNGVGIFVGSGANVTVSGFNVTASGSGSIVSPVGYGVVSDQARATVRNCAVGACGVAQIHTANSGVLVLESATLSGANQSALSVGPGSLLWAQNCTLTLSGTPSYAQGFVAATFGGVINIPGATFIGSATGSRAQITLNGIVNTNTSGAPNYLPGNAGGVANTGGQYL